MGAVLRPFPELQRQRPCALCLGQERRNVRPVLPSLRRHDSRYHVLGSGPPTRLLKKDGRDDCHGDGSPQLGLRGAL
jgi:hypothetical protein